MEDCADEETLFVEQMGGMLNQAGVGLPTHSTGHSSKPIADQNDEFRADGRRYFRKVM